MRSQVQGSSFKVVFLSLDLGMGTDIFIILQGRAF